MLLFAIHEQKMLKGHLNKKNVWLFKEVQEGRQTCSQS